MSGALLLFLSALRLTALPKHTHTGDDVYYELPRFWTNTGFCPAGDINRKDITETLLSHPVQTNLRYISALPNGAMTHIRIHWLLELLQFVQFTQAGVPIYDFTNLDTFLMNLDELGLSPVIEFMANPGNVFVKNPNRNGFLWEDFSFQVAKHYLNILGAAKVLRWRFESWNEPDLSSYNKLNFTVEEYLVYMDSLRSGLAAAGRRPVNSLHFPLRGPAGLFKAKPKHPLCWQILEQCSLDIMRCPLEVLTYHRKGNGTASSEILKASSWLLETIYEEYPALKTLPVSNDEADPIAGWSTPRSFQEDVHYAVTLISIVLDHWSAKLQRNEFRCLESISHDNAFLSYHPHEFSQRTLLAHFRMNTTHQPPHSQFIQKPVYAALGMLSKLGPLAADVEIIETPNGQIRLLKTTVADDEPLFLSWIAVPQENSKDFTNFTLRRKLPFELCYQEVFVFVMEILEQERTDPAYVWHSFDSPAYPNATIREAMRRSQAPILHSTDVLDEAQLAVNMGDWQLPWVMLFRVCTNLAERLKQPQQLTLTSVTHNEVLLTWRELANSTRCLKTYQVWFQVSETGSNWVWISKGWHVPFPSFQFAPTNGSVNGFYKVRGVDFFNSNGKFSDIVEFLEV